MEYYVAKQAGSQQLGTKEQPFSTISQAAERALPGDTVLIGGGIYREWVSPANGGLSDDNRITYAALPGQTPVVSGAEELTGWQPVQPNVWTTSVDNAFFGDYNPYADAIFGDWYTDLEPVHHTGEVFVDGRALYEVPTLELLCAGHREWGWHAQVGEKRTTFTIHTPGVDPNASLTECSVRPFGFFPREEKRSFITVRGLTVEKVATQWAPPTAFQPGAIGPNWARGWVIEGCTVRDSKCTGISLGKRRDDKDNIWSLDPTKGGAQTYTEIIFSNLRRDWNKNEVGGHRIEGNHVYNCGQAGIVGCMGAAFSTITRNVIHDINVRGEFTGAEMSAIKLHCAIDVTIEHNLLFRSVRGLWLDWEAQGARVSRNAFFENQSEDLFIEVCHGPTTVEHNLFLSRRSFLNVSQGTALVHNLFAGEISMHPDTSRFTMYHFPHDTFIAGSMFIYGGDDRVLNNLFIGNGLENCGTVVYEGYRDAAQGVALTTSDCPTVYADNTFPVHIRGNLYLNGARRWSGEPESSQQPDAAVWSVTEENGAFYLDLNLPDSAYAATASLVSTETLGKAFESEAAYENTDSTPFTLDTDFAGYMHGGNTLPGPFAIPTTRVRLTPEGM